MEEEKVEKEPIQEPKRKVFLPFILILVIVVLFVIFTAIYYQKTKEGKNEGEITTEGKKVFSAVFLTNGQVYFGYLEGLNTSYPKLANIYYLQLRNPQPQQTNVSREEIDKAAEQGIKEETKKEETTTTPPPSQPAQSQESQQPELTLVKLGSELHGPIDSMTINKDHILFVEEMKDDSKVVQAIQEFEKQKLEEAQKQQEENK